MTLEQKLTRIGLIGLAIAGVIFVVLVSFSIIGVWTDDARFGNTALSLLLLPLVVSGAGGLICLSIAPDFDDTDD